MADLQGRSLRLPTLSSGEPCPTSLGKTVALANAVGPAILVGAVGVMIPQQGNVAQGIVDLAPSDIAGWYGIKTHWLVKPSYQGPVLVRAESLSRSSGWISIHADASPGPLVIPSGPDANGADGWREQPSGSYVKGPGCYGVQFDGTSFSVSLVFEVVVP